MLQPLVNKKKCAYILLSVPLTKWKKISKEHSEIIIDIKGNFNGCARCDNKNIIE